MLTFRSIFTDSNGIIWSCTVDGTVNTVGTFKRLVSLAPSTGNGVPSSGSHEKGEIYIDAAGNFYYCTVDGTPGTWHSISGSVGTTSTLTLLDAPFRLVDTLNGANLNPGIGSIPGFSTISGGDRTNVNANTRSFTGVGSSIPANATAITGYLYANAQAQSFTIRPGFGYLTLWKEGTLYPLATQSHGVVSLYYPHNVPTGSAFTVPLSAAGKFSVASDSTTNIIIDVTGYYS